MDVNAYLKRIHFLGIGITDFFALEKLIQAHIMAVPFENIDIQLRCPIVLDTSSIFRKVVLNERGGYCYELNGLFGALLKAIGFQVHYISGSIIKGKNIGPLYDHLALLVVIGSKRWLVDVGFGDFSMKPLLIDDPNPQFDGRHYYQIQPRDNHFVVGKWLPDHRHFVSEYAFSLLPRQLSEFKDINDIKQSQPDSHFTQNLICTIPTANGRTTLINNRLIQTIGKKKTETTLIGNDAIWSVLKKHFNAPEMENRKGVPFCFEALNAYHQS